MLQVEIRVRGQIGEQWSDWFEGLNVVPEDKNETLLAGDVLDQTALYGMLTRARDLGLSLISVQVAEASNH